MVAPPPTHSSHEPHCFFLPVYCVSKISKALSPALCTANNKETLCVHLCDKLRHEKKDLKMKQMKNHDNILFLLDFAAERSQIWAMH